LIRPLILLLLLPFTSLAQIPARSEAFYERTYELSLPLMLKNQQLSLVKVQLKGESWQRIDAASLAQAINDYLKPEHQIHKKSGWLSSVELPFPLSYNPQMAQLEAMPRLEQLAAQDLDLSFRPSEMYKEKALQAATWGGAINYRVEKAWGAKNLGGESFSSFFDSFINIHGVVLESQVSYTDDQQGQGWFRGDTRLIKDFPQRRIRTEAGDVYPQPFGFMQTSPIGGVKIARNFSLDPYRIPFPQGQGQFTLLTRSQVKTFVNGVLIKDEMLPAGNYDLRDVPLINGLNTVLVETTDELGQKQVYEFRLPTSVGLLKKGEYNFSLSHGRPFQNQTFKREYLRTEQTSAFYQHGLSATQSLGGYAQRQEDFTLLGLEAGQATNLGNLFLGAVASQEDQTSSGAGSLTWQLQNLGSKLFESYTLTLRHERYSDGFKNQKYQGFSSLRSQYQANITLPVRELFTLSVGGSRAQLRDSSLADRQGFDTTINIRAFRNLNLNLFASRTRDEHRKMNTIAYAFFTWTFDQANHFVSGFHDLENKSNRLTAVKDNGNRLYDPRLTAIVDEARERDGVEVDGFIPTPMADVGGRLSASRLKNASHTDLRGVARLSSALVFAKHSDGLGLGFSRPVPNSFVLFKPSEELKKQKIALRSTSPFAEGESGPLGEITFTNILPYQYREIQLDPTGLDLGVSLEQEKFIVYPTYRSAHLIALREKGSLMAQGKLVDKSGKAIALKVGEINQNVFFTSKTGQFFIEGLAPGEYEINIEGMKPYQLNFPPSARGIIDLGQIQLEGEE
jgi:outer membrane usher protein